MNEKQKEVEVSKTQVVVRMILLNQWRFMVKVTIEGQITILDE